MTLDKAIAVLTKTPYLVTHEEEPGFQKAIQLSIKALERCQLARKETSFVGPALLPGETKD